MANLSERKERIIKAVVEDYINFAEPISSGDIKDRHLNEISSATIRNELSALEEMGYLYQPHTSAGRIPTSEAYKLYIEKLMPKHKLSKKELSKIKSCFDSQIVQMSDVLKRTAKVISDVTHYASLAFVTDISDAVIENIKAVKLTPFAALVIVVTNIGVLKDTTVDLQENLDDSYFEAVSKLAVQVFGGKKIIQLKNPDEIITEAVMQYKQIFDAIFEIINRYSENIQEKEVVMEGALNLLEYPEYNDINKAKALVSMMEAKEQLLPVLRNNDNVQLSIKIGKDTENENLRECAVVTASYSVNGKTVGQAGVIGPIRMDYSKVISVLDYVAKIISEIDYSREKKVIDNDSDNDNEKD